MTDATRQRWIAFGLVALVAFVIFLAALPSGITGGDAGELTVAAYFLGIPHPPGYPTWCLAAHPFTWIPYGSIAWRVALSSAVFGALAAGVVSLIVLELCEAKPPSMGYDGRTLFVAILAGLVFATAKPVYEQAVIAEVYMLNALCFSLCVYFLLRWTIDQRLGWLYGLALATGLGQGVHNTMTLLAPLFAGYVVWIQPAFLRQPRRMLLCLLLFATGCCTYLYLPIRSFANPPVDWGDPETWDNFRAVLQRDQFAFMYDQYPRSLERFVHQILDMSTQTVTGLTVLFPLLLVITLPFTTIGSGPSFGVEVGLMLCLLALLLSMALYKAGRSRRVLVAGTALLPVLVIVWVQNPLPTAEWREVMFPFCIPGVWGAAIAIGVLLGRGAGFPLLRMLAGAALTLFLIPSAFVALFLSHFTSFTEERWVDDYARNLLRQLPPNALFFPGPDHAAFPILYLQNVEKVREDVRIGNPYGYVDVALLADAPEALRDELGARPRRGLDGRYYSWLLTHTTRPVYFNQIPELDEGVGIRFRQEGLLYRALTDPDDPDTFPTWPENYDWSVHLHRMRDSFAPTYTARQIAAEVQFKRLSYEYATLDVYPWRVENLTGLIEDDPEYLNNTAILLARHDEGALAQELLEKALVCDPGNETVRRNLERLKARP